MTDHLNNQSKSRRVPCTAGDVAPLSGINSAIGGRAATIEQILEAAAAVVEQYSDGKLVDASTLSDDQLLASM